MTKNDFTLELANKLPNISQEEIDERLSFYTEMIDDRMEEGLSEEEAVAAIGSIDEFASQVLADIPLSKIVKEKIKSNRKMKAWEIVLLILGFPVWFPILVSIFAIFLSLYITLWSVIISLWAAFASVAASFLVGMLTGVCFICAGFSASGWFMIGCAIVCSGMSILLFYGCKYSTKGILNISKKIVLYIKHCLVKKEER